MTVRPDRDADLGAASREIRTLCSKVGVADKDLESSSVELEARLSSLAECLRLSAEPVLSFGKLARA
jgi:hypothetical protein